MKKIIIGLFCFGGALAVFVGAAAGVFSNAAPKDRLPVPQVGPPSVTRNVDGGSWKLKSYAANGERTCIQNTVPGEAIGTTCLPTSEVFSEGRDLLVLPGARQRQDSVPLEWDNIWVSGLASSRVAKLSLVFTDCSTQSVDIADDGAFLYVVPAARIRGHVVPHRLLAVGASGHLIDSEDFDVGVPKRAEQAGLTSPEPKRDCT